MNFLRCPLLAAFLTIVAGGDAIGAVADRTASPYFQVRGDAATAVDALALTDTDVEVTIAGMIADVAITQTYENHGAAPLEAVYVFPGSTRAAVHGLTMFVGDRVVRAEIQTKPQARQTFDQARSAGRTASLLEQHRPNVFQMNLANIPPGEVVRVELRYTELLVATDGEYEFVFPTIVASRASDDPTADAMARAMRPGSETNAPTFGLRLQLASGVPLGEVRCATHPVAIVRPRADLATLTLEAASDPTAHANRDFILHYRLAGDAVHSGLLLAGRGTPEEPGYFLAMVQPPSRPEAALVPSRDYVFVVDVSGSMAGFPLQTARALLGELIAELRPEDTFNVVLFAGAAAVLAPAPLPATPENLAAAIVLLERQRGGGGTDLLAALERVRTIPRHEPVSRTIVVVTDGYVDVEAEAFDLVRRQLDQANFFAFGIGGSVNRHLIESLARAGLGEPFVVTAPEDAPDAAARFRRYITHPVLTRVRATTAGIAVSDATPAALPDVFAQRPVMWLGRWTGPRHGRIGVTGVNGDGEYSAVLDLESAVHLGESRVLELLWARSQITDLEDREACTPAPEMAAAITRLGLNHGLLTKYTSFVAVDQARQLPVVSASPKLVAMPVPATPEPAATGMLVLTALALAWVVWRRRGAAPSPASIEVGR